MTFIDSHLHFDSFAEAGELDGLLDRAERAGVRQMVAIGGTTPANELAVSLALQHPGRIHAAVGFDRDEAARSPLAEELAGAVSGPGVVAVGETGLDYHYSADTAEEQRRLLRCMLDVAHVHQLPVVMHSRDAEEDTVGLLQSHVDGFPGDPARVGVLHCFTGSISFARRLLDIGFYISFSGIVSFKNADPLREVARFVPPDRLLIETDAPYLAPVPHRGKRNEPAYVVQVAEAVAQIRNDSLEHIADITSRNARALFALPERG